MRTAFIDELESIAASDPNVWLVTGDLGYSVVDSFAQRFPDQFLNAGVAEQSMIGAAAGLARSGAHVFVYSIANFPTFRCLEQIRNDLCYAQTDVTVVSVGSGFSYGALGSTHHAIEDLAVMRALPGMRVVSPGDPAEARLATRALAALPGPSYLRLGKAGERVVPSAVPGFEVGTMRQIRPGSDVTVIASGAVLALAAEAAEMLAAEGVRARLYSAHTLRPFDAATLERALSETAGLVTVEEHRLIGGLRSAVAEALLDLPASGRGKVRSIGVDPDELAGTGDQTYLRESTGISAAEIVAAARDVIDSRSSQGPDSA